MNSIMHNSIELMRGLHMWWKSMHVKKAYDVYIRLKKDEAPYIETIIIPSAYKIRQAVKDTVARGYIKETIGTEDSPINGLYTYNVNDNNVRDLYIINTCISKNNSGYINIDTAGLSNGTKVDFLIKITDINGIGNTWSYIKVDNKSSIRGAVTMNTAIVNANYITTRYEIIFSMTIEKIGGITYITRFNPFPGFIVSNNGSTAAIFNPYNGMFRNPF